MLSCLCLFRSVGSLRLDLQFSRSRVGEGCRGDADLGLGKSRGVVGPVLRHRSRSVPDERAMGLCVVIASGLDHSVSAPTIALAFFETCLPWHPATTTPMRTASTMMAAAMIATRFPRPTLAFATIVPTVWLSDMAQSVVIDSAEAMGSRRAARSLGLLRANVCASVALGRTEQRIIFAIGPCPPPPISRSRATRSSTGGE